MFYNKGIHDRFIELFESILSDLYYISELRHFILQKIFDFRS